MKLNRKIIFVGSPIPESMIEDHHTMSFNTADNIAQLGIVKGLYKYYGDDLTVITELSKSYGSHVNLGDGVEAIVVKSYDTNRILYYLSLMSSYTKILTTTIKAYDKSDEIVIVTRGSYIFIALPVFFVRVIRRVKWVPFIITTVEVPEYKFPLSIISNMSIWTTKKADGIITYVAKTAQDYIPGKPYVEVVYSISEKIIQLYRSHIPKRPKRFTITYTGSLDDKYNTEAIVEAIKKTGRRYRWEFAGTGKDAENIQSLTKDKRYDVHYHGRISNIEVVRLQVNSHLLLCLRRHHDEVNEYYYKYAASAKLAEYLCSGVPVLASDAPANSEKINKFISLEKSTEVNDIIKDIEMIENNYDSKVKLAKEGQQFAFKHFTADYQNKNIYDFIEGL